MSEENVVCRYDPEMAKKAMENTMKQIQAMKEQRAALSAGSVKQGAEEEENDGEE